MPRPREFARQEVVEAAKEVFWDLGYHGATIVDLEERTGLNRSSLYLAFGDKRALFEAALQDYVGSFMDPLIGTMEVTGAGLVEIAAFFSGVRAALVDGPSSGARGCLMVNTIAEDGGRKEDATDAGVLFRDHLRQGFTHALEGAAATGAMPRTSIERRARMLAATTFGVWINARIDPQEAVDLCDAVVSEVTSWSVTPGSGNPR